jgi:hypothetical protein
MDSESRLVYCIYALFTFICMNLFCFSYQTHATSSNVILKVSYCLSLFRIIVILQVRELPGAPYSLHLEDQRVWFRAVFFSGEAAFDIST